MAKFFRSGIRKLVKTSPNANEDALIDKIDSDKELLRKAIEKVRDKQNSTVVPKKLRKIS